MQKIFFILIHLFTASIISCNLITVFVTTGESFLIENNKTVAELFRKCRNQGFCQSPKLLVLYFNQYEIIENSEASNKILWDYGNHVAYATVSYYQAQNSESQTISIRATNGMVTKLKTSQTPAYFFRACRSAGHCPTTEPMILKFGFYEIKENTPAANKRFSEFNTNINYAYVMNPNNNITNNTGMNQTGQTGANEQQIDTTTWASTLLLGLLGLLYLTNY